ncbi:MAG: PilZ domain-containing protein [Candidatus Omnitrophica bacterium]|nr:PilZ domain-containing protein [Candidatus Omnitrophota bacterium]MDD5437301.1 PilZ domain-containing protein [Candidatus Omnitrophota bacterium]
MVTTERRAFPRVRDEGLALQLNAGDFDTMTHTMDVSASGIYCKIDKEIPLMSRVRIKLMVPDAKTSKALDVDGVVVREHPVIVDGVVKHYDAAIFFDNLSPKSREVIQNYISTKKKGEGAC